MEASCQDCARGQSWRNAPDSERLNPMADWMMSETMERPLRAATRPATRALDLLAAVARRSSKRETPARPKRDNLGRCLRPRSSSAP